MEFLVSITLFTVITTIAVVSNGKFNSSVVLTNLAYEVALSIRQAQFYGISVKAPSTSSAFDSGFGVHFDLASGQSTSYIIFEDRDPSPGNGTYNSNRQYDSGEALETFQLRKGNYISRMCFNGSTSNCVTASSPASRRRVDITFLRPDPDAYIRRGDGQTYTRVDVCLSSPDGSDRKIIVESTGQIAVSTNASGC